MGNINEKNSQRVDKKETEKVMLDPQGHFDPWTIRQDKKEARAIEAVLVPSIEPRYPPSPEYNLEQGFGPRVHSDVIRGGSLILPAEPCVELPEEPSLPEDSSPNIPEAGQEDHASNDSSLPISDSTIPDTFELMDIMTLTSDTLNEVSMPIISGIRSLGTIEELDEEEALITDIDENLTEESLPPLDIPVMHDNGHTFRSYAASRLLAPAECASAITYQVLEDSPYPLASNSAGVALQQNVDIPLAPGSSSLPPPAIGMTPATVLSPLVLDPPALTVEDVVVVISDEASSIKLNRLADDSDNETPRPSMVSSVARLDPETQYSSLGDDSLTLKHPCPTPSAPYLDTIPLPPFPTEENAGLFVSEPFANSGLGLIVPKNSVGSTEPVSASKDPGDLSVDYIECKEAQVIVEEEGLAPTRDVTRHGTSSVDEKPSAITPNVFCASTVVPQTYFSVGIQADTFENEIDLISSAIDTLKISGDPPSFSPKITQSLVPVQEAETATLNSNSEELTPVISEMKTYTDATKIAIQHPGSAKEVLQIPIISHHSSSAVFDRFFKKIEGREGPEHTPDRPNWAKAPVEGDTTSVSSGPKVPCDAINCKKHTANDPNWAIAPDLKYISSRKPGLGKRERGRNRTRKGKKDQNNSKNEGPRPSTPASSIQKAPTKSAVQKSAKEKSEASFQDMPQFQFVPSEEQRKIAANRQKVNKWINHSASVMVSPKYNTERESIATVSCSAFLMDSVSERVINESAGEIARFEKEPLSPASRMAKALAAREARMRGFHNDELINGEVHAKSRTSDSALITSVDEHMDGSSPLQDDRKTSVDKGKKPVAGNPSPVGRQRSASVASSLVSGISARSGVSSSSRLFQRAIQQIGSLACPRSASADHNWTRQIPAPAQGEAKGPLETANAATESPEPPSRQSPELDATPVATIAVTCPEITVTREATEQSNPLFPGKAEAEAPLHQISESNTERFMFSFKPPQASIASEGHKALEGSRDAISPYTMQLGSVTVPTMRYEGNVMKTQRATSMRTFIPRGKYVPPPIREGQVKRQTQVPPTPLARDALPGATTTSQTQEAPHSVQYPGVLATPGATLDLHTHAQPMNLSDDAFLKAQYHAFPSTPAGSTMDDVNSDIRFGAAGSSLGVIQEEYENVRLMPYIHHGQVNPNFGPMNPDANANKPGFARFPPEPCATFYRKDLFVYDRQGRVVQVLQVPEDKSCPQTPRQKLNYMTQLALTQEKLQQDILDLANTGYGEPETFNPTVTANQFQSLNLRAHESRVNFGQTMTFNEPKNFLQSPICTEILNPTLAPRPSLLPHLQSQTGVPLTPHGLFEEYSRRQRRETRMVHENMMARLPRRKS